MNKSVTKEKGQLRPKSLDTITKRGLQLSSQLSLENGADINKQNNLRETALHGAGSKRQLGPCKQLLEQGANIEAKDNDGIAVLHNAASSGYERLVWLLLSESANIEAKDNMGCTPLVMQPVADMRT